MNDHSAFPFKINASTWGAKRMKLRNLFGRLQDADLAFVEGEETELIDRLRTKLGKTETEVRRLIDGL